MNELLKIVLSLSLSGTLLILLLLLSRPLWEERLPKSWQYYIWLVVILRLLLPWTPEESPVGNFFLYTQQRLEAGLLAPENAINPETNAAPQPERKTEPQTETEKEPNTTPKTITNADTQPEIPQRQNLSLSQAFQTSLYFIIQNLWLVWLVTALVLFIRKITVYQSFVTYIKAGCEPVADIGRLEYLGELAQQAHIRGGIELHTNGLISSPLLIGFFRPRIILVSDELPETDFRYTILHELTHCRRLDMFYKWLVQFTVCLHWFNPFVYRMQREISRACELSCDASVIRNLDGRQKRAYGNTLLNAMEAKGSYSNPHASITLNESKELLKGRLEAIMKHKQISKPMQILTLLFTVLLAGGAFAIGSYAIPVSAASSGTTSASDTAAGVAPVPGNTANSASVSNAADSVSSHITDILEEDGQYFILCDGATEKDCPSGGVTDGYISLTLVCQDGYSTIGPFSVNRLNANQKLSRLTEDVTSYCTELLKKGKITQEEKDLFTAAAARIQAEQTQAADDTRSYTGYIYSQEGYYMGPYIFSIGWNLHESDRENYTDAEVVTLNDGTSLTVFFDPSCQNLMQDREAAKILIELLSSMKKETEGTDLPLKLPLVAGIQYVGNQDVYELAEQYYKDGNPFSFTAVFPKLDQDTRKQYLEQAYEDRNIALFAASVDKLMPDDTILDTYAQKAYREGSTSFFSVLTEYMDNERLQYWTDKASEDKKTAFLFICLDAAGSAY